MARQSPGQRNAEEHPAGNPVDPATEVDGSTEAEPAIRTSGTDSAESTAGSDRVTTLDAGVQDTVVPEENGASGPGDSSEDTDSSEEDTPRITAVDRPVWRDVRIDPVELALPVGSGYTLRAYRMGSLLAPTEVAERDEDDPFAQRVRPSSLLEDETVALDDEFGEPDEDGEDDADRGAAGRRAGRAHRAAVEDEWDEEELTAEEGDGEELGAHDGEEAGEEAKEDEEVPVFLSHHGKLLLFRSAESLVAFVRSGAPHDLAQVDTWAELVERIEPADIVAREEDSYELDLVVENLRGGHDAWDVDLLIKAGELARDIGYALRLEALLTALAPGSPLDDLDEALRKTADGGLSGFLGRRRLRKIGAQQATLGWRTIIGKISGAVDWRD